MSLLRALVIVSTVLAVHANPAPTPAPAPAPAPAPQVLSTVESFFSSVTGAAASALPTVVGGWPSLDDIEKKLGLNPNSSELQSAPVSALLIPSYSNFTASGWNVRFYGLAYKLPQNVNTSDVVSLIDGLSEQNLNNTQSLLLQNRTHDLTSIPVPHENLTAVVIQNGTTASPSPIVLATADDVGEFDQFIPVPGLGNETGRIQLVETGILNLGGPGNSTSILVPTEGISIISDIDDVLRVTKVYVPNEGLNNSFVNPYVNENGMPELFQHWLRTLPNVSFHYDTTTPVQLTRTYVDYLFANYPVGSLEMRPINITDPSQILDARQNSLLKLFQTFPHRKFVLVGDTSSSTLLSAYPQIALQFPNNIACIFIRNTSATDPDDKIPYNTQPFKNVTNGTYFFYNDPQDLFNLNITSGQCVNSSIPNDVQFGEQGGFLGNAALRLGSSMTQVWSVIAAGIVAVVFTLV